MDDLIGRRVANADASVAAAMRLGGSPRFSIARNPNVECERSASHASLPTGMRVRIQRLTVAGGTPIRTPTGVTTSYAREKRGSTQPVQSSARSPACGRFV
jgi:hypothetical protein